MSAGSCSFALVVALLSGAVPSASVAATAASEVASAPFTAATMTAFVSAPVAAAVVSALVSAAVAWATARRGVRAEIEKLRLGAQQKLLEQLVAARLVVYPKLYAMLSDLWKTPPMPAEEASALAELLKKVNVWDSDHSILLGPHTTNVCWEFRQVLTEAANVASKSPVEEVERRRLRDEIIRTGQLLELALRSDLGIYGVQVTASPDALQMPRKRDYE